MLKVADLAGRPDFDAGPLRISPARRLVEGPAGSAGVEPIVMKVFLLLLDAGGSVVTRDDLFENAWGGVFVGDDSLNRAVARVRKIAAETAPGLFEIETIPRTGYRLTGQIVGQLNTSASQAVPTWSRRTLIGASTASILAAGTAGYGLWQFKRSRQQRFDDLIGQAQERLEYNDGSLAAVKPLERALRIRPSDPTAQGLLAYAMLAKAPLDGSSPDRASPNEAEAAANASLSADPHNPNARLARILLERSTLDLAANEDRLSAVLASAPSNIFVMRHLWELLQSAGRSHEALRLVERAISIKPLAASANFPLGQLLWIVGRVAEADRVIDRAMQFWPQHPFVRFARYTIFAFTGRPRAALEMLDRDDQRPQYFSAPSTALWRTSLLALENPSRSNVAKATDANVAAVKHNPGFVRQAMLVLPALGAVDAAFDIANEVFLYRAATDRTTPNSGSGRGAGSLAWRFAPYLFVPATNALRADPRFATLADGIGLTAYWAKRGVRPDYQLERG